MLGDNLKYFKRILNRIGAKEKPFDTNPALITLTDVLLTYNNIGDGQGMEPTILGLFTCLPAIKAVYAYCVRGSDNPSTQPARFQRWVYSLQSWVEVDRPQREPISLQPGVSNLTHLEPRNCQLRIKDLQNMLWASKSLKTVIYEIGLEDFLFCDFSELGLQEALRPVESSVENLWLDYRSDTMTDPYGIMDPMSFTTFKSLKFLRIASVFLYGTKMIDDGDREQESSDNEQEFPITRTFPPQIQVLEVNHHSHNDITLIEITERLLLQKQASTELTCLKSLVLQDPSCMWEISSSSRFVALLKTAELIGVKITLVNNSLEYRYDADENILWGLSGGIKWAFIRERPTARLFEESEDDS